MIENRFQLSGWQAFCLLSAWLLLIKCMAPAVAIPQFKDVIDIFSDGWEAYIALTLLNWQSVMRRNI